ncbi:hypothetical protein VD0003_g7963 [Verticillium dahliae]|nr:hypothetical protein VD0003_g7963 [Verticillium dahliae]
MPQSPKATPSPSTSDTERDVDYFFAFIAALKSRGGYQRVKELAHRHEAQERELTELHVAYKTNLNELSLRGIEQEKEKREHTEAVRALEARLATAERERVAAENAKESEETKVGNLCAQVWDWEQKVLRVTETAKAHEKDNLNLKAKNKELKEKVSLLEGREKALNANLSSLQSDLVKKSEELRKAQNELAAVRSHITKMPSLEVNRVQICQGLNSAFRGVLDFLGAELTADLPESCLEDGAAWAGIRDHQAIRRTAIPLPPTNTPAAKRMRVFAALVVLADALVKHIFRPTYFLHQGEELDRALEELGKSHSGHGAFIRAVLLKATASGKHDPASSRSALVVREVAAAVQHWIPADRSDQFHEAMRCLTDLLRETWQIVQRTRQRVDPSLSLEVPEEWRRLPSITVQEDGRTQPRPSVASSQPSVPLGASDDVIGTVWPAFLARVEDDFDLVHPGYALTREDVKDASEEVSRRGARRNARRNGTMNGANRRDSGVAFLSTGESAA